MEVVPNSSSETAVQSQTSAAAGLGLENQSSSMREMDDKQLVIGLAAATAKIGVQTSTTTEIKPVAVGTVVVQQPVIQKRKRGRPSRGQGQGQGPKPWPAKLSREEEEDVCFICFDGGSLVLCDRKGCPKAYHPACIKRDEAFFQSKAKWNCGWHICSVCQKSSHHLCYTCTYSLCKGCARGAEYVSVRGNKGFCTTCMKTIMLIENKDTGSKESVQVDFDDKSSWEYLFKVYWVCLKSRLSLTLDELIKAKNPLQGLVPLGNKQQPPDKINSIQDSVVSVSGDSLKHLELQVPKEQPELPTQDSISPEKPSSDRSAMLNGCVEWASRELLEFVAHMRNGDTSLISQFDVQALLLDYIKMNNLRDPRRKSQIICDFRLKNLFRKLRVGHIEMLKLLEYHFLIKEDTQKNSFIPAGIVGNVTTQVGADCRDDPTSNQNKKRRTRKKVEERAPQTNLDEFAAIDVHNINLIYLRRNLMENLLGDMEKFHDKVVGSIVRIRVSCNDAKQDIYRLVQVVGTGKTAEPYKIGDRTADIMLEVLNLDRKETISIDGISNQEFSEDECRRLRRSIKCRLVKRFTVGEIQIKAITLQEVRLNDWLESEILRLNHLRDRANEKGRIKELRECVEKLQLLKTPEERQRRLTEIPEVHADPNMNPNYESEEDVAVDNKKTQGEFSRLRHFKFDINGSQAIHPNRRVNEDGPVRTQQIDEKRDAQGPNSCLMHENQVIAGGSSSGWNNQAVVSSGLESSAALSVDSPPIDGSEMEKMWHYRDPNGKVQGPFSMMQLRKWSMTGYFPDDMRIWINNEQNGSILVTDALNGQLYKASLLLHNFSMQSQGSEVGLASRLSAADGRSRFTSGNEGDSKQEGFFQRNDSRVHFSNSLEIARSEESGPVSSDWSTPAVDKDLLPQSLEPCDLSKSKSSCSDHSPMVSPVQSFNLVPTSVSPLNQAKEHKVEEFNSVVDHGKESSLGKTVHHVSGGEDHNKPSSSQSYGWGQSSGQSCRSIPLNVDLNQKDSGIAASAKPSDSSEWNGTDLLGLPSPMPKRCTGQSAEKPVLISVELPVQMAGISEFPSPTPKPMDEDLSTQTPNPADAVLQSPTPKPMDEDLSTQTPNPADAVLQSPTPKLKDEGQRRKIAEEKQTAPSKVSFQDSGPTAGVEVGGSRLREITNEWGGYSSSHAKPSVEEWDSSIASMLSLKQPEAVGDQVAIPNSNSDPVTHSSQSQPAPNVPIWQALFDEPIEFSTLAEESVSDLLAEVDAMESRSGLASPTSGMKYSDERNDCFSSIEELSPTPDAGKSDACSADIQFPSQPTVDDPVGASQVDAFDPLKRSGGHSTSSSESETKSVDAPINQREAGSDIHPSQSIVGGNMARGRGLEIDPGWATAQGNMNMGWGGPPHSFSNMGWGPGMGTPWGNTNYNVGAYNGNVAWDSPRRYGGERFVGSRDWGYQGPDVGYGRARPWSRQQHGGGGGYSRPSPKGQRVCKFYESGHCKKGASCGYLHP